MKIKSDVIIQSQKCHIVTKDGVQFLMGHLVLCFLKGVPHQASVRTLYPNLISKSLINTGYLCTKIKLQHTDTGSGILYLTIIHICDCLCHQSFRTKQDSFEYRVVRPKIYYITLTFNKYTAVLKLHVKIISANNITKPCMTMPQYGQILQIKNLM